MELEITKQALQTIKNFKSPKSVGFGTLMAPAMITSAYKDGKWSTPKMIPYGPLSLGPTAKALHYGQEIFEGLKSYFVGSEFPLLFRPLLNAERFNRSAERMAMPEIPTDIFLSSVQAMAHYLRDFIPRLSGESLYLRPFMFATEQHIGIRPAEEFLFAVIATPVNKYFSGDNIKVLIERDMIRAAPGGTGSAKTGGNYAASLKGAKKAKQLGYDQTLWLDALKRVQIEELGGMNLFFMVDGVLKTPALTDTILPGITRQSIIELCQSRGQQVEEEILRIDEILAQIGNGRCSEIFACGTAAVITPISALGEENGPEYHLAFPNGKVSLELKRELLDIQEGRIAGPENWVTKVSSPL